MNKQLIAFALIATVLITGFTLVMSMKKQELSLEEISSECLKFDTYFIDDSPYSFWTVQNICDTNLIFDLTNQLIFPPTLETTKCMAPNEILKTDLITFAQISGTARSC